MNNVMDNNFIYRVRGSLLPIEYLSMKTSSGVIHYYSVRFLESFGIFVSGEFYLCLTIDLVGGKIICGDKVQDFKIFPCYCNI